MTLRLGVLGGAGQVGTELRRRAERERVVVFAPASTEVDITQGAELKSWIEHARPDLIVNCAAYTAVDRAEDEPDRAFAVNATGARLLAQASCAARIPLVHLSTDYVFAGDKTEPYVEEDVPGPLNVYGRSKLRGETEILAHATNATILRVAWVFSEHGRNFVKAILARARESGTLSVVDDQVGGPTSARAITDAVWTMIQPALKGQSGVYHLEARPHVTWFRFAQEVVERAQARSLLDRSVVLGPIPTKQFPTRARRPTNSRLNGARIRRDHAVEPSEWTFELNYVLDQLASRRE